ncbi:heparinase II/III family protein [Microvirga sp. W0021]|uniref:Heparinase II/III family protein n=1 Tax=Hohaiivirga grylli TaxID=3133970 RepID=A0ABV0BIZ2_9HYPH
MSERLGHRRVIQLAIREAGRACRAVCLNTFARLSLKKQSPSRLLFAPQDLRTGDATIASDIYSGFFVFSGRAVTTSGRSPFEYEPPTEAWGEALYSFGWLRHLRAANTALAQANARALVDDFLNQSADLPKISNRTDVKARRLMAFICQSPLLLEGADRGFYQRFLKAIGRTVRELERDARSFQSARFRLIAAIACCYAGLCSEGLELQLQKTTRILLKELDEQIFPDGGHISRNPSLLIEYLFYLLPLRQLFSSRGVDMPPALIGAIDRMIPMIRMLRHGDGNVARFNGMATTDADYLATLLLYDEVRAKPILHAPHSGYERLEAGRMVILVDAGKAPPFEHSTETTAGTLSFEMSYGEQQIVVNCGSPYYAKPDVRQAARTTAAHSAASIDRASTMTFLTISGKGIIRWLSEWLVGRLGCIVLSGPARVQCERGNWNNGTMLSASHDGFSRGFGVSHERRWFVSEDGLRINGEDVFQGAVGSNEVTLRFHLAPTVRAAKAEQSDAIILAMPDGDLWQFDASPAARIEDSVFFASSLGAKKTLQLVVSFRLNEANTVRWRFFRIGSSGLENNEQVAQSDNQ